MSSPCVIGRMRGALGDAFDPAGPVPVEHGDVLPDGDLLHGLVQLGQVEVDGAPIGVVELDARDAELRSHLDQGQHTSLGPGDALGRSRDRCDPAQVGGRMLPAVRPGEIDQLARGEIRGEPALGFVVDGGPAGLRNWRQVPM